MSIHSDRFQEPPAPCGPGELSQYYYSLNRCCLPTRAAASVQNLRPLHAAGMVASSCYCWSQRKPGSRPSFRSRSPIRLTPAPDEATRQIGTNMPKQKFARLYRYGESALVLPHRIRVAWTTEPMSLQPLVKCSRSAVRVFVWEKDAKQRGSEPHFLGQGSPNQPSAEYCGFLYFAILGLIPAIDVLT